MDLEARARKKVLGKQREIWMARWPAWTLLLVCLKNAWLLTFFPKPNQNPELRLLQRDENSDPMTCQNLLIPV